MLLFVFLFQPFRGIKKYVVGVRVGCDVGDGRWCLVVAAVIVAVLLTRVVSFQVLAGDAEESLLVLRATENCGTG